MSECEGYAEGDVVDITERWKVVGVEETDILAMPVVDGEPQGCVHRWMHGFEREGAEVTKVNE